MATTVTEDTMCRACHALCALKVDFVDGRPTRVVGDKNNPIYHGYTCIKGRELGNYHSLSSRLLQSLERGPDGVHRPIESGQMIGRIAAKIEALVRAHGPRSVAFYIGTHGFTNLPTHAMALALIEAIGSPMLFTSVTIDQPGKGIALALHGPWLAGTPPIESWETLLLIGTNPLVSMNGGLGVNPARQLHEARRRGLSLIVVDPRRTESAAQADIHLQTRPGEDAAVLSGIAHQLIVNGWIDADFIAGETVGFEALKRSVAAFTPDRVEAQAGIKPADLIEAARLFGAARRGAVSCGTGPNMAGRGNLTEYFVRVLTSLRGFWSKAGEIRSNPGVMMNPFPAIAASPGPFPAFGFGEKLRVGGLSDTPSGLPTNALPDEILLDGEGQVRALFVFGGNPMLAFPDQVKTKRAMEKLELLVTFDPHLSETGKLAHYTVAPKLPFECMSTTMANEWLGAFGPGWGYELPYAQYVPPLMDPPAGSDLVEEWEVLWGIAHHLGLTMRLRDFSRLDPAEGRTEGGDIDPVAKPTTDEIWAILTKGSPVPLDEIRRTARAGRLFDRPPQVIAPKPADWTGRLDIGSTLMIEELDEIAAAGIASPPSERPYRMISRRLHDVLNSCWHEAPGLKRRRPFNPAFMNPDDMAREGILAGQQIEIISDRGQVRAVAEPEVGVRAGCISLAHAWGRNPGDEEDPAGEGAPASRLIDADGWVDRFTAIPLMSNIAVSVRPV